MTEVFVLLPRELDADLWSQAFLRGEVPDRSPYGYHLAASPELRVAFSRSTRPRGIVRLWQVMLAKLLGFDWTHLWRNRKAVLGADWVWTHTEREFLAVCALLAITRPSVRPLLLAQSVWLMDSWPKLSPIKRQLFRYLIGYADVLTFLSPENAALAKKRFPESKVEPVPFGIAAETFGGSASRPTSMHDPRRVLVLGNDRHRDWTVLAEALGGTDAHVRIGSRSFPLHLTRDNFEVVQLNLSEVRASMAWADCVVLPLKENAHASGITVILEAVALGVPVIATSTGGLDAYFGPECITYVPPGNPEALRGAAMNLSHAVARQKASCALRILTEKRLTTQGYVDRQIAICRTIDQHRAETKVRHKDMKASYQGEGRAPGEGIGVAKAYRS